jgi:hypothetical protein
MFEQTAVQFTTMRNDKLREVPDQVHAENSMTLHSAHLKKLFINMKKTYQCREGYQK